MHRELERMGVSIMQPKPNLSICILKSLQLRIVIVPAKVFIKDSDCYNF